MIRYCITEGWTPDGVVVMQHMARLAGSIDILQIREKDLSAGALARLAGGVVRAAWPGLKVLVNDRADIATACGCAGVHLRADSISAAEIRRIAPEHFVISVACHSLADVVRADAEGADLALLAPIFATPGKGVPLGLDVLAKAARTVEIPVLALGGVTSDRVAACMAAGAGGVAGIRLFSASALRSAPVPSGQF